MTHGDSDSSSDDDLPRLDDWLAARRHQTANLVTPTKKQPRKPQGLSESTSKPVTQSTSSARVTARSRPVAESHSTPRRTSPRLARLNDGQQSAQLQPQIDRHEHIPSSSARKHRELAEQLFPPDDLRSPLTAYRDRKEASDSDSNSGDDESEREAFRVRRSVSVVMDSEPESEAIRFETALRRPPIPMTPNRTATTGRPRESIVTHVSDSEDERSSTEAAPRTGSSAKEPVQAPRLPAGAGSSTPSPPSPKMPGTSHPDLDLSILTLRDGASSARGLRGSKLTGSAFTPKHNQARSPAMSTFQMSHTSIEVSADDSDEGGETQEPPSRKSSMKGIAEEQDPFNLNDGVLIYEPTPRKPKKLVASDLYPTNSPRRGPKSPMKGRSKPTRVLEIDLTASSDSDSEDDFTPDIKPRKLGTPARKKTTTTPKATPRRTPTTPASSALVLTSAERDTLPLQLIRELDRAVFRKRWDGVRCLDADGEANGPGLPEGITINWNNKLRNTAGRASWKKIKNGNVTTHVTSIDLATKVTDTEEKLRHTLSHEICHIAAWVLSHEVKPPHGDAFKLWAKRVMSVRRDITITTTHAYEIAYKYRWRCLESSCGKLFSRHSRSIDPNTQGCPCGSRLGEIDAQGGWKTPRAARTPQPKSSWQEFLAVTAPIVRAEMPGIRSEDVFKIVAERYKQAKSLGAISPSMASRAGATPNSNDSLVAAMKKLDV